MFSSVQERSISLDERHYLSKGYCRRFTRQMRATSALVAGYKVMY